jgi:hypothetical protein
VAFVRPLTVALVPVANVGELISTGDAFVLS